MIRYIVRQGDTLHAIARRHNTTIDGIMRLNNLSNPNLISVGQVLVIEAGTVNTGGNQGLVHTPQSPVQSPSQHSQTAHFEGLRYILSTDRRTYERGRDSARITLAKCNTSREIIRLRYNTGQRFDFAAFQAGREIWRWSDNQFFTPATGTVTLRPGECMSESVTWNLRNRFGNFVSSGAFQIRGFNVANQLRNRFAAININVVGPGGAPSPGPSPGPGPAPGPGGVCTQENILRDPGLERWSSASSPAVWSGQNISRSSISFRGSSAAELGAVANREAVLSQTVNIAPGRIYQVGFHARENVRPGRVDNFRLEVEILLFDRQGTFISRVDPVFRPGAIPDGRYQQYSFSTGVLPRTAQRASLRFVFRPERNNNNTVNIDEVSLRCFR